VDLSGRGQQLSREPGTFTTLTLPTPGAMIARHGAYGEERLSWLRALTSFASSGRCSGRPKYGRFSRKGDWNQGIPIDAIAALLTRRKLWHLLDQVPPVP
jgi:hypothetical protein